MEIKLTNANTGKHKVMDRAVWSANLVAELKAGWHVSAERSPARSEPLAGIHDPSFVSAEYAATTECGGWAD